MDSGAFVLHVDPDLAARESVADNLSDLGYVVRSAADGPAGLAQFDAQPPELALVSTRLRGMDAGDVCRRLKELAGETFLPVIFVTTATDVAEKVRALDAGADDLCVEPVRFAELDVRMRALLRLRQREQRMASESDRIRFIAYVDALTGLGNRRALDMDLSHAWARAARSGRPLALLMADVDHFKTFNDRHGHRSGDEVLRHVARAIEGAVRKGDHVYRMGGEEFVILAPDSAASAAFAIGERVRRGVSDTLVTPPEDAPSREPLAVTVSIGMAIAPDPRIADPAALLEAADRALYDAKSAGRNRVVSSATTL